jgi:hypothetical protein
MNRRLGFHCLPLLACVLSAPRWLAVFSDLPVFPAPSNALEFRVAAVEFVVGRACVEVDRVDADAVEGEEYPRSGFTD